MAKGSEGEFDIWGEKGGNKGFGEYEYMRTPCNVHVCLLQASAGHHIVLISCEKEIVLFRRWGWPRGAATRHPGANGAHPDS